MICQQETERAKAANILQDEIASIYFKLERAELTLIEICENYFTGLNKTETGRMYIAHGYPAAAIKADITLDYLSAALKEIKKLDALSGKRADIKKEEAQS